MITLKPELQKPIQLEMKTSSPKHITNAGKVGFAGSAARGGIVTDFAELLRKQMAGGQGQQIAELSQKTGAGPGVLRDTAGGFANGVSFSGEMLKAIDKVSGLENRASSLVQQAITDPGSVDAHDITIAEAEAAMALNIARTVLNRITQAWRDIINTR